MRNVGEIGVLQSREQRRRRILRIVLGIGLAIAVMITVVLAVKAMQGFGVLGKLIISTLLVLLGGCALFLIEKQLIRCPRCGSQMDFTGEGQKIPVVWIVAPHYLATPSCPKCGYPKNPIDQKLDSDRNRYFGRR